MQTVRLLMKLLWAAGKEEQPYRAAAWQQHLLNEEHLGATGIPPCIMVSSSFQTVTADSNLKRWL